MKIAASLLVTVLMGLPLHGTPETREAYNKVVAPLYSRLETIYAGARLSADEIIVILFQIDQAWEKLPPEDKAFLARRRWHDHRIAAKALL